MSTLTSHRMMAIGAVVLLLLQLLLAPIQPAAAVASAFYSRCSPGLVGHAQQLQQLQHLK